MPTASNEDVEATLDSTGTESTPLLADTSEEASAKSGPIWSRASLGSGFIWIQAGSSSKSPTQLKTDKSLSNILQRLPLWLRRHSHSIYLRNHRVKLQRGQYGIVDHNLISHHHDRIPAPLWPLLGCSG